MRNYIDVSDLFTEDGTFIDPTRGKLPPFLIEALQDPFDYALGLRDGRTVHFSEVQLLKGGKWIRLIGSEGLTYEGGARGTIEMSGVTYGFPRGLDVRIDDIVWIAKAPNGS